MKTKTIIGSNVDAQTNPNGRAIGDDIAMQMASITYCSLNGNQNVINTTQQYLPDWQVVWMPKEEINGNWACLFFNGVQYVIAIRGSILQFSWASFDNWFKEDFNIFEQTPWIYTDNLAAGAMISQGSADGLAALTGLVDSNNETIWDYLNANCFPNDNFICVTGHSLGGNLCTVYALWLQYQMQQNNIPKPGIFSVLSFAAPTSWNQAFVDQFTAAFTNSWRYFSEIDIVPFSACDIEGLGLLFYPAPMANNITVTFDNKTVSLADAFLAIDAALIVSQEYYGSWYAPVNQTRGSIPLNTNKSLYPMDKTKPLIEQWFEQAGAQHDHNHYLDWLGAKEVNCV